MKSGFWPHRILSSRWSSVLVQPHLRLTSNGLGHCPFWLQTPPKGPENANYGCVAFQFSFWFPFTSRRMGGRGVPLKKDPNQPKLNILPRTPANSKSARVGGGGTPKKEDRPKTKLNFLHGTWGGYPDKKADPNQADPIFRRDPWAPCEAPRQCRGGATPWRATIRRGSASFCDVHGLGSSDGVELLDPPKPR